MKKKVYKLQTVDNNITNKNLQSNKYSLQVFFQIFPCTTGVFQLKHKLIA